MPRILVTGASGFVGAALSTSLAARGEIVRAAARNAASLEQPLGAAQLDSRSIEPIVIEGIGPQTTWAHALEGVDAIAHLAARVHVMRDRSRDPLAEFRRVNVEGTLNLARQAAAAGVRRLVFVSSIKVNGEGTSPQRPYRPDDKPAPVDAYGVSKHEAEVGLRLLSQQTGLEVVIIRPVLVYGAGVKGNFLSMMRWLSKGIPLPLGAIHNLRSFVALGNLVDLIQACLNAPGAANQTFLVSDGEDLSTTSLLRRLGDALGKPARLLPIPAAALQSVAVILGRREIMQRLCGSLQVDMSRTRSLLSWSPPISVEEGLRSTAAAYLSSSAVRRANGQNDA
jgi:nucleoside-diphosphate-sugar epimerase